MPVSMDFKSPSMIVKGYSKAKLLKFGGFDKNSVNVKFTVPSQVYGGQFKSKARVLFVPLNNEGTFHIKLSKFLSTFMDFYKGFYFDYS